MNKIKDIAVSYKGGIKDNTEEISEKIKKTILEKSRPYRRILEAFPEAFKEQANKTKVAIENATKEIKNNLNEAKNKAIVNIGESVNVGKEKINSLKVNSQNNARFYKIQYKKKYNNLKRNIKKRFK